MESDAAQDIIQTWYFQETLLEFYRYAPGRADALPKHCHEDYQFCLSLDFPGQYYYRGSYYEVPASSLSVIHPLEVHSARDLEDRLTPSTFRVMYAHPELLQTVATEISRRADSLPFFAMPIILDSDLANCFLALHQATETEAARLEQDDLLLLVLEQFILRYADTRRSSRLFGAEHSRVQQVRDYLRSHLSENVSLAHLAEITDLSPYHLHRVFRQEIGLPPHQYQVQLRVDRAKALLCQGLSLKEVAEQTGFADQSHLARHFKRLMRVTPGQYSLLKSPNF